jgi:hypothetical protein
LGPQTALGSGLSGDSNELFSDQFLPSIKKEGTFPPQEPL